MTEDPRASSLGEAGKFPKGHRSSLARARHTAGFTLGDLGRVLQRSPQWLSEVERGNLLPTLQQKIEISAALRFPVDVVFPPEDDDE